MNYSKLSAYVIILFSIGFITSTIMMDKANIGNPIAPKIFPFGLGVLMLLCGLGLAIQERKQALTNENFKLAINEQAKFIIKIVITSLIYVFIFKKLGYIFSTILFLGAVLYIFNGKEKPIRSVIVAIVFSVGIYILFSEVLGIRLPSFNLF